MPATKEAKEKLYGKMFSLGKKREMHAQPIAADEEAPKVDYPDIYEITDQQIPTLKGMQGGDTGTLIAKFRVRRATDRMDKPAQFTLELLKGNVVKDGKGGS